MEIKVLVYRNILLILLLLTSCKTTDYWTYSRIKSGKTDFFFSQEQFDKEGIAGYAQVWDERKGDYRIYPYTYKVHKELTNIYYKYHDWVYVGRGNQILDPHYSDGKPSGDFIEFKKIKGHD